MIMKKVYAINNMVEYLTNVKVGSATISITFRNGFLTSQGFEPCVFETENPVVQFAIESCPRYKSGFIFLKAQYGEVKKPLVVEESKTTDFPDVKNSQDAKNILADEPYNVPLMELANKDVIKAKALELNVTFSNWK